MSSAYSLPVPRVPIVGREKELADARRLLLRDDVCLLTLTGPGGIGKTRLALQLAADVREHFDQSYSVSLAPVGDPDLVLAVIAQAMNVEQAAGEVLLDRSAGVLRDKKSLLVLDSFEHVIPAAPLLSDLLSVAPGLTILVTSREALRVYGEFEFPVPPLSVPDPAHISSLDHLGDYDAVRLF